MILAIEFLHNWIRLDQSRPEQTKRNWLKAFHLIGIPNVRSWSIRTGPYNIDGLVHGLLTPREEIALTAWPKIHSHSQIFRYSQSIFCLPHRPNFSDIFDLCLHWVSVVRAFTNPNVHVVHCTTLYLLTGHSRTYKKCDSNIQPKAFRNWKTEPKNLFSFDEFKWMNSCKSVINTYYCILASDAGTPNLIESLLAYALT